MDHSMLQARNEGGAYRRVELITGRRRRQNWSTAEKARIVAESVDPDANISEVARRNGVSRGLLTVWRRQAREAGGTLDGEALFAAVRLTSDEDRRETAGVETESAAAPAVSGSIEIAIGDATIRVPMGADGATVDAVIRALRRAR
jgi:transposase